MSSRPKGPRHATKGTLGQKERFKAKRKDPYRAQKKLPEPSACKTCGAAYVAGRWVWETADPDANQVVCPACQRIEDDYPAGVIELKGAFVERHRDEIMGLIHNTEALEKWQHPLERLMGIQQEGTSTIINTTGIHLARRIGDALTHAYKGVLTLHYGQSDRHVRVYWQR